MLSEMQLGHWIGWNGGGSVRLGLVSLLTEIGLFTLMTVPGVLNNLYPIYVR
jgi:hypothetical protein